MSILYMGRWLSEWLNFFQPILDKFTYLKDGQGNCGVISAVVHAVATSAGYKARLLGGNCLDRDGRAPFGRRGGHFWVEMPDGTVIDGAGTNRIQVYLPDVIGYRMIPVIGYRRGAACMRNTRTWLDLSDTIQQRIAKDGLGYQWAELEAA
ncbi:transglutaminase domain-containing protein [Sinorhizobium meliloti]|nr:transglutaminase domain-containing protein [Sinorhizobium meliloti]WKL42304.1 transglutaminase domain-containing protein [Sinorhizobium meliloti]